MHGTYNIKFMFCISKIPFSIKAHLPNLVVYRKGLLFTVIAMHVSHVTAHCGNSQTIRCTRFPVSQICSQYEHK